MAFRIALGVWGLVGTAGLVLWGFDGRIPPGAAVDGLAALVALVALWLVVKLPWDLYFAARGVQRAQDDSGAREIAVDPAERAEARTLARRLLALALSLHVLGAATCAVLASAAGDTIGFVAAGAFLVTMGLRPLGAMVVHVQRRLRELQGRAVVPRADARQLLGRVGSLEARVHLIEQRIEDGQTGLSALDSRLRELSGAVDTGLHGVNVRQQRDVQALRVDLDRAVERLARDQEVVSGIRAFVSMVRDVPG